MKRRHITNQYISDKVLCLTLCVTCFALVGAYMYLLSASIVHVVIRKEVSQDIVQLQSEISELETQYIKAQHRVSKEIASFSGYESVHEKIFIDRAPTSLVLSE